MYSNVRHNPNTEFHMNWHHRVEKDFPPTPWDEMSADQRRSIALQFDYQHDPMRDQAGGD
ncbi:MAG: hypothetical protein WAZ34_06295 [Rhodocyclaceae bacterium]